MASKILLKKSTTASAVPTTSDVDVGEVAVNTEDKRLFTQDNGGSVVELGTTPSSVAVTGNATVGGTLGVTGTTTLGTANIDTATVTTALSVPTPTLDAHAATKGYVDTEVSSAVATVIDSSPAALDTLNELAAALGDDPNFSATITTSIGTKLPKDGSEAMTGDLDLGTNNVVNVADPTADQHAATKVYVDTADALKLNLSGGTMSGAIAMGDNKVTGLATPTDNDDAATKFYIDSFVSDVTDLTQAVADAEAAQAAAETAQGLAEDAQNDAEIAQTGAETALTDFDSVYMRALSTAPALDRNGNALTAGDLYFDTTASSMYVYDGSAWDQVALTPGDFLTVNNNLSDLNDADTAVSNLGLSSTYTGDLVATNVTLGGYLRGPSSFTIDPATHGDDTGTVVIAGNLQVDGVTTTINSTTVTVDDKNMVLASGAADGTAADGAGITIDGANVSFTYDNTNTRMSLDTGFEIEGTTFINEVVENCTIDNTTTGTLNFDALTQAVVYLDTDQTADRTLNFRGDASTSLDTAMAIGESMTFAVLATQGATPYYFNTIQIDGTGVTPKYQGGTAPTAGNASGIDSYSFTIIKTGSATFTVLASQTQFA